MNKIHSRLLVSRVETALSVLPVVVVTGARQTGKTTLVRHLVHDSSQRTYYSLDSIDIREQARTDPASLLSRFPISLDEVQKAPEILVALKQKVDEDPRPGMALLTGSANLSLLHQVSETLAGRAVYLDLSPFCPLEWHDPAPELESVIGKLFQEDFEASDWPDRRGAWEGWLLRGGFPPAVSLLDDSRRSLWFTGYVQTYLERDLRALSSVSDLADFRRVMQLAAHRSARLLNESEVARDAAVTQPTCHRYFNLLEASCLITRVPTYATSGAKGVVKSKKLLWNDSGLAAWLADITSTESLQGRPDEGFWLEQAVFQSLNVWRGMDPGRRRIYYWRERGGCAVDFILQEGNRIVPMELKRSSLVRRDDCKGLEAFTRSLPPHQDRIVRSVVLYHGTDPRPLGNNSVALPIGVLF